MKRRAAIALALAACVLHPAPARGQTADTVCSAVLRTAGISGIPAYLARLGALTDTIAPHELLIRRSGTAVSIGMCAAPQAVSTLAARVHEPAGNALSLRSTELLMLGNSGYPQLTVDGALWNGRGVNAAISTGVAFRWRWISASLAPVVAWQSNASFQYPAPQVDSTHSSYAHPFLPRFLDVPTRFGDGAYLTLDPGDSYVRIDAGPVGVGVSNEQVVWGPSLRNPLILSGAAPGFPHLFFETARPVSIGIGRLSAQTFWGVLSESDYFDTDRDNDNRLLAGLALAFHPYVLDGFSVGLGRVYSSTLWPEISLWDAARDAYTDVRGNPRGRAGDNQLITLFFRWAAPRGAFEAYGEWAREDHWEGTLGLLRGLDASQAWTLGFQKLFGDGRTWRVHAEATHLAEPAPYRTELRDGPAPFYANTSVTQGHTQRGQILGAPLGTGGEAQHVGIDRMHRRGITGISLTRSRYEDDSYVMLHADTYGSRARDTELSLRASHMMPLAGGVLSAGLGWSRRYNRGFLGLQADGSTTQFRRDDNISAHIAFVLGGRELR